MSKKNSQTIVFYLMLLLFLFIPMLSYSKSIKSSTDFKSGPITLNVFLKNTLNSTAIKNKQGNSTLDISLKEYNNINSNDLLIEGNFNLVSFIDLKLNINDFMDRENSFTYYSRDSFLPTSFSAKVMIDIIKLFGD